MEYILSEHISKDHALLWFCLRMFMFACVFDTLLMVIKLLCWTHEKGIAEGVHEFEEINHQTMFFMAIQNILCMDIEKSAF